MFIELRNLTKQFGNRKALDNISLQITEGEILGLLGPNGSGKTTLLKVLAFLEKPDGGEIRFQEETVTEAKTERLRLQSAMVFQRTLLFSTTVYNNVAYGLKIRKTPKKIVESEVKRVLELVRLEGFEKRSAKRLSGGEQQRVALARTLVLKTKLLLLDEPTANLDPKNTQIIEDVITKVNREFGTTIVIATHNMFQAKVLPDRIALMNDGKVTEIGSPREIFGRLSKSLASFAAVDNTFRGSARVTSEGTTLVDIGNGIKVEVASQLEGEMSVFVNPQDIILSRGVIESSARNVFKGRIVEIMDTGGLVNLRVDVGRLFVVQITKRSFMEMQLNLNSEVFVVFKASNVQVI